MLNVPKLTDSDVSHFERDGYLIVRGAFPSDQMNSIASWTDELLAMPEESGKHWVYREPSLKNDGEDLVNRIEKIGPFHAGFLELSEALKAPVGQLLGEEAVLFKEKINFKMPGGGGFKPHQDSQAGWDCYADFFISVLVTIDAATEENGCLQICAGHHKRGLYTSWQPLTEEDMTDMDFVSVPTDPGDLIFFRLLRPPSVPTEHERQNPPYLFRDVQSAFGRQPSRAVLCRQVRELSARHRPPTE